MNPNPEKLCIHTITTKPWSLEEALDQYASNEVPGISVWQNAVLPMGAVKAGELIGKYPVEVVSYVRGGFFPGTTVQQRQKAIHHNKVMLDEAAAVKAPILVLVCGADPAQSLSQSRSQIQAGIEAILPHAESLGVKLAIEPLHPMYAGARSAINTLEQANDMAERIASEYVGVAIDVYHLWWDQDLEKEIARCGRNGNLLAYHICDWKVPTEDMLNDRGLMGEGCIPLAKIRKWVTEAGFSGFHEVEIFSNRYWATDQKAFLNKILHAYHHSS